MHTKFEEKSLQVKFDRVFAYTEYRAEFFIGGTGVKQLNDFHLPLAETSLKHRSYALQLRRSDITLQNIAGHV